MHRNWALPTLLAMVFGIGFISMPSQTYIGDPYTWREESRSLVLNGSLAIETPGAKEFGDLGEFFVTNPRDGKLYSKYGIMNGLLNALPLAAERVATGQLPAWDSPKRVLYLNVFYILISMGIAFFLFRICGFFSSSPWLSVVFVFLCFYFTYLWNYLRAQSSEAPQLLFFSATSYYLLSYAHRPKKRTLLAVWLSLCFLVLTKVSFLLIAPVVAATVASVERPRLNAKIALGKVILPCLFIGGALGWVDWLKFGKPLWTGYHAWRVDLVTPIFSEFFGGLHDFFIDPQWSIFTHFPLLLIAAFGARSFYSKYRRETLVILGVFLLYVVLIGCMPSRRGEWGYGPRYLLFILPLLALPLLEVLEQLKSRKSLALLSVLVVGLSGFMQLQVNRLDFFFAYRIGRGRFSISETFPGRPYALVNWEFVRARENLDRLEYIIGLKNSSEKEWLEQKHLVAGLLEKQNYYWFEDWPKERSF